MDLGKYINELLLDNEIVIIPGFGSFISNHKPAEFNETDNTITPPSKKITFNQKIRNNDGLLVDKVACNEGISHFDALKKIEKERENILYHLDKGEKVSLEKTGELERDENHNIRFIAFREEHLLLDSFGLELLSLDDVLKIEETEDSESEISEIQDNKDGDQVDDTERTEKGQPDGSQKPESNIDKIAEFVSVDGQRPANEKKKPGWIWFLLVLTPVIAAGVFVVINGGNINILTRKSTENLTIKNETISNYNDLTAQDTIQDDSISLMPADSLEIVDTDTIQNSISDQDSTGSSLNSAPKYYLIAGSFKEEENAEKFLAQFNVEGFEPFHLGKIRNFYYIAAGTYETEEKALAAKKEFMEKKPESEIWIYWE